MHSSLLLTLYVCNLPPSHYSFILTTPFVVGGAAGIGRETAILFAQNGCDGILVSDVNEAGLKETVKLVEEKGGRCIYALADVSKDSDVKNMIDKAEKEFGKVTVLFNNAGMSFVLLIAYPLIVLLILSLYPT